jgi:DNA-binding XRE family transcriptional regulator
VVIHRLVDFNPKRPGTKTAQRFGHYRDRMSLTEALDLGITLDDLRWDADHEYIRVEPELPEVRRQAPPRGYGSSMGKDLHQLSAGEQLWLWRNRQLSPTGRRRSRIGTGMSQPEAAQLLGVSTQYYNKAERDRLEIRDIHNLLPQIIKSPALAELLALARRRSRRPLREITPELGLTRPPTPGSSTTGGNRGLSFRFTFPRPAGKDRRCGTSP